MTHQLFIHRSSDHGRRPFIRYSPGFRVLVWTIFWNKFWNEPSFLFLLIGIFEHFLEIFRKIFARINFETNQLVIFFVLILKWYVPNYFSKAVNSISKLHYEIRFFHKHKMPSLQNRKLLLIESKTKTN